MRKKISILKKIFLDTPRVARHSKCTGFLNQFGIFLLLQFPLTITAMCPPNDFELGNCTQREMLRFEQYWETEQQSRREKESESFMFTRPIYRNIGIQQSLWHDFVFCKEGIVGGAFQIIGMYQKSFTSKSAERYFLFNHSNTLSVKGDTVTTKGNRDIRAEWLGLPPQFSGEFSINPKQQQASVWFEYNQDIYPFICWDYLKPFWFSVALPFQYIENDITLTQATLSNPMPNTIGPNSIAEALNQPAWNYGKFGPKEKEIALAELYTKLGARFLDHDGFQIGMYSFFNFPLHHAQNAEFIFSPYIGHNRHFGYGTGATFQLPLTQKCSNYMIAFVFNIENIRFFSNKQHRSLDLKNKPWSRFLLLNNKDGKKNIPGINVLTQKVSVNPFNMVDLEGAFRLQKDNFEAEIGYCLWAHGDERVKLVEPWQEVWGIAGNGADVPGTIIGATASGSTICNRACNDILVNPVTCQPEISMDPITCAMPTVPIATFVPIKERDLDFLSASARSALVHRAHLALGWFTPDDFAVAAFFGLGAYVQIPNNNTDLRNWGVWGKVGASF